MPFHIIEKITTTFLYSRRWDLDPPIHRPTGLGSRSIQWPGSPPFTHLTTEFRGHDELHGGPPFERGE